MRIHTEDALRWTFVCIDQSLYYAISQK